MVVECGRVLSRSSAQLWWEAPIRCDLSGIRSRGGGVGDRASSAVAKAMGSRQGQT